MIEVVVFLFVVSGIYFYKTKTAIYRICFIQDGKVEEIIFENEGSEAELERDEQWVYNTAKNGIHTEYDFLGIVNEKDEIIYQVRINKE